MDVDLHSLLLLTHLEVCLTAALATEVPLALYAVVSWLAVEALVALALGLFSVSDELHAFMEAVELLFFLLNGGL